jgi:3',5'-nucleoside bisphosphate phosphatase
MRKYVLFLIVLALFSQPVFALDPNNEPVPGLETAHYRKEVRIPDIMGMRTLKCDFHIHTMFSDGMVWPTARVIEAWLDGLDVISITDHIENHPGKAHVGGDDNSSYEIALPAAKQYGILLVKGGEITRDMPEGHYNALFLEDTQALDVEDFMTAVETAINQGAFIQWNHPGWKRQQPEVTRWQDVPDTLYKKGWLHGVEVFNSSQWYPVALGWCIDKNLTVTANSDIHGIIMDQYDTRNGQRPMTLVFAEDRSIPAIKDALFAGRTAAFFGGILAGRPAYLEAIFRQAIDIEPPHLVDDKGNRYLLLMNRSDVPFTLEGAGDGWRGRLELPARKGNMLRLPKGGNAVKVRVTNLHTNLNEVLETTITVPEK